ncbi:hypothetical protein BKA83DRAFT_377871 [Pisolithus microcarpus]|nr:hypothetical protein BKA83DRAFT_377871 [Pisolithus microcarpus]
MHLLGTGSCLVGVTTGRTPAQAQALCDMSEYGATFVAARAHSSSSYPAARFMNSRRMQHARRLRTASPSLSFVVYKALTTHSAKVQPIGRFISIVSTTPLRPHSPVGALRSDSIGVTSPLHIVI